MGEDKTLPSNIEFYLQVFLYNSVDLSSLNKEKRKEYLKTILFPEDGFDAYCTECHRNSFFTLRSHPELMTSGQRDLQREWNRLISITPRLKNLESPTPGQTKRNLTQQEQQSISTFRRQIQQANQAIDQSLLSNNLFSVEFTCSRDDSHIMGFVFRINDDLVKKVGQFPPMADINNPDIRKYRKLLGDQYKEFSKAIGLASHGIGAGSFVYLRRIFENLIEDAHIIAKEIDGWDEELYTRSRMVEKVQMLNSHLPSFLVENAHMYGILSKGIHELDEKECIESFDAVRVGIELILDEQLQRLEREKKIEHAELSLQHLKAKHS